MFQPLFVRSLTDEEKELLATRSDSAARDESWRAAVILRSAQGESAAQIGRALGFHPSNVKKWIRKFNQDGISGIAARKRGPREGPKPRFTRDDVDRLLELAASDPASLGLGFEKWTAQKLANAAVELGIVERISHVTVRQLLKRNSESQAKIRPAGDGAAGFGRAVGHLAAGKRALADSDYEQAASRLYQALKENPGVVEDEAEIRCLLCQALEELSRFEDAFDVVGKYDDPQNLSSLSPRTRAYARLRVGWVHSWLKNQPKAIASLNDAKKIFLELQDELGVCETHYALGRTYIDISEFRIARDHLLAAADSQVTTSDRELLAKIYLQIGTVDFYEGAFSACKEVYLKALDL